MRVFYMARQVLNRSGFVESLGEGRMWHSISAGVRAARKDLGINVKARPQLPDDDDMDERIAAERGVAGRVFRHKRGQPALVAVGIEVDVPGRRPPDRGPRFSECSWLERLRSVGPVRDGPSDPREVSRFFGFQGESNVVVHCWVRYSRLNSVWSFPVAWIGPIRSGSSTSS